MKNYHSILDVPVNASPEQIKGQYKQLVRIYHPDRFTDPNDKTYAEQKLKEIIEAYHALAAAEKQWQAAFDQDDDIDQPPKPIVSNDLLDFGSLSAGSRSTLKLQVGNVGGSAKSLNFIYSDENSWFKVTNGKPVYKDKPVPIEVNIDANTVNLEPGKRYDGWIDVTMDHVATRVVLSVQVVAARTHIPFSTRLIMSTVVLFLLMSGIIATSFLSRSNLSVWSFINGSPPSLSLPWTSPGTLAAGVPPAQQLNFSVYENHRQTLYSAHIGDTKQQSLGIEGQSLVWSPNGKWMAYLAERNSVLQLYVMQSASGQPRQLTDSPEQKSALAWSKDSNQIAFIAGGIGEGVLTIIDIETGGVQSVVAPDQNGIQYFAWDPQEQYILFDIDNSEISTEDDVFEGHDIEHLIYKADLNTGEVLPFTHFSSRSPAWSPNGEMVAVGSNDGIYLLDREGSGLRQLTPEPAWSISWSFDGSKIAFLSEPEKGSTAPDLWKIDSDGQNLIRLTTSGSVTYAWSPTGERLAYVTGTTQTHPPTLYLWMIEAESDGEPQLIAEINEPHVSWMP